MQAVPLSPQPSFRVGGSRSGGQWQVGGGPQRNRAPAGRGRRGGCGRPVEGGQQRGGVRLGQPTLRFQRHRCSWLKLGPRRPRPPAATPGSPGSSGPRGLLVLGLVLEVGFHCERTGPCRVRATQGRGRPSAGPPTSPAYSWGSMGLSTTFRSASIHARCSDSVSQASRNRRSGVTMVIPCGQWWPWVDGGSPSSTV